ncbi:hypothetical protein LguiA_031552 [Lonicera macranthoides]
MRKCTKMSLILRTKVIDLILNISKGIEIHHVPQDINTNYIYNVRGEIKIAQKGGG